MASLAPVFRVNAMTPRHKTLLVSLVGLLWAGGLLAAYWWFEIRYIRPFSEQTTLFSGDSLRLPAEPGRAGGDPPGAFLGPGLPLQRRQPAAPRRADRTLRRQGRGVPCPAEAWQPGPPAGQPGRPAPLAGLPGSEQLPASPAVAIWDRDGRLAYFGPYSEGAVCTSSNSFIEPILEALLQGRPVDATHTLAVGCYCPWTPEKG